MPSATVDGSAQTSWRPNDKQRPATDGTQEVLSPEPDEAAAEIPEATFQTAG